MKKSIQENKTQSDVGAPSTSPGSIVIFGDDNGHGYFVNPFNGTIIGSGVVNFLFGSLVSSPVVKNGIVYFGLSNPTQQATSIHIMEAATAKDLVPGGIQLQGSIDGTPALNQNNLFSAVSTGILYVFDINDPVNPSLLSNYQFTTSNPLVVNATIVDANGQLLYISSSKGLFAVDIQDPNDPQLIWSAETSRSFSGFTPVLASGYLYAVSGDTLFAFNLSQSIVNSVLSSEWSWANTNSKDLGNPIFIAYNQILVGDTVGKFHLIGTDSQQLNSTLTLAGTSGISAQFSLYDDKTLYAISASGTLYAYTVDLSTSITSPVKLWSVNLPGTGKSPLSIHYVVSRKYTGKVVYITSSNGYLYGIKASNGTQLFKTGLPKASSSSLMTYPSSSAWTVSSSASIDFLLDGETFFPTFRNLILAVTYNTFNITPAQVPAKPNIIEMLEEVATKKNDVFVLLWDIGAPRRIFNALDKYLGVNVGFDFNASTDFIKRLNGSGSSYIHAALEKYVDANGLILGESNHQKIVIASVNGEKIAIVSGLNLVPIYYDDVSHPDQPPNFHTWHDTAVIIQGDAANLVEQEFDRRWTDYGSGSPNSSTSSYIKFGFWKAHQKLCLDNPGVCDQGKTPSPYVDPRPKGPNVDMDVLVTNFDQLIEPEIYSIPFGGGMHIHYRPLCQIRAAIIESIGKASEYVYFENVSLYDTPIVEALIAKALSAGSSFQVIIMTPQPTFDDDSTQKKYNIFSKIAFNAMKLAMDDWDSFKDVSGTTFLRSSYTSQELIFYETAIENTILRLTDAGGNSTDKVVRQIETLTSNDKKFVFCGPARYFSTIPSGGNKAAIPSYALNYRSIYVHSKLALFDDQVAIIGSANFTARSMYQDGELSVRINNPATVLSIRQSLFTHWGMTTPDNWVTDMNKFENSPTEGVGVLSQHLGNLATLQALPSYLGRLMTEI